MMPDLAGHSMLGERGWPCLLGSRKPHCLLCGVKAMRRGEGSKASWELVSPRVKVRWRIKAEETQGSLRGAWASPGTKVPAALGSCGPPTA